MKIAIYLEVSVIFLLFFIAGCTTEDMNNITGSLLRSRDIGLQKISGLNVKPEISEAKIELATTIAGSINDAELSVISIEKIQSYEDYVTMIGSLNLAINAVNNHFDQEFDTLLSDRQSFGKFTAAADRYSPLVKSYNELVRASIFFNKKDEDSVDLVISATAGLGVELFLIHDGSLNKQVFNNFGEFSAKVGLFKISNICGPCVGKALEPLYKSSKKSIVDKGGDLYAYFSKLRKN